MTDISPLPSNPEAEKSVLSGMIARPEQASLATAMLTGDDFSVPAHRVIFAALLELSRKDISITLHSLTLHLINSGLLQDAGGGALLADLVSFGDEDLAFAATLVAEKSVRRQLYLAGERIKTLAASNGRGQDDDALISECGALIESCRRAVGGHEAKRMRESLSDLVGLIMERMEAGAESDRGGLLPRLTTGIRWLDSQRQGYERGCLAVLAALSHGGKTALARFGLINQAAAGLKCLLFSLESTVQREAAQVLATTAPVRLSSINNTLFDAADLARITAVGDASMLDNLWIDDSGSLTIEQIAARARAHHARHGLDVVVIDHGLNVTPTDRRAEKRDQCAHISREAKALAKRINGVVVLLWQFSKEGQKKGLGGQCPGKSDLRETSAVFEDSDYALFLHCPDLKADGSFGPGRELYVPKWRNGGTLEAPIKLHFDGETQNFALA